jgi:hypothetical protein
MASRPNRHPGNATVKNGKEAYQQCLTRCARGLRRRKSGGSVSAPRDLRSCALCAAAGTPGRSGGRTRIWADIMRRRQGNANHRIK